VSQQDFIFSNKFRHRAARHGAFILVCWLFFLISFYLPLKVFPGWNTDAFAGNIARIGLPRWVWLRLANSMLIYIPLLAFAYSVIYFLLPQYFFNKKNRGIATITFFGISMCLLVLQYLGSWLVAYNWVSANPAVRTMPGFKNIVGENIGILLFNYPIEAGAELQLLKSQIHPHFLFNTLNNVYFLTLTESQKAPEMLIKLSDMLRYILDECNNPQVLLEKEIKMVEDYMALEKIRYGDNLEMNLQVKGDHHRKMIVPLLLIPLVENSFKHGTSKMLKRPWVNLNISVEEQSLVFLLSNSKPDELSLPEHSGHIGLNNVKKRLHLLYPAAHELKIAETRNSFEIFMKIDLQERKVAQKEAITESINYELA
jgi:hypothetical protein